MTSIQFLAKATVFLCDVVSCNGSKYQDDGLLGCDAM
jgi:hypothetical protein